MTRKQRHAVAVATTVLTLAGGGGVAWACTGDPGYPGSTGTTTTSGTTTTAAGTTAGSTTGGSTTADSTTTTAASTSAAVRRSVRSHAARRARHSRRSG